MDWVCLDDHTVLAAREGGWCCPECGHEYEAPDGIPIFTRQDGESTRVRGAVPILDDLWRSMQDRTSDDAATAFCEAQGCVRTPYRTDWKLFFAPRPEGITLEIGAGFGDDSIDLASGPGRVISIVPTLVNGRIVKRHLAERGAESGAIAAMDKLSRLPLPDGSVDAIVMEDAAAPGFGMTGSGFPAVAKEWRRVLSPRGSVFLGVANRYLGLPGARRLTQILRTEGRLESMNRSIKRAGGGGSRGPGLGRAVRGMVLHGFSRPIVHAPLPDENDAQLVIPVDDDRVLRYFLDNLIRKNSTVVRLAVRGAELLVALKLFRYVVPYYYLVFRIDADPPSPATLAR